MFPECLAEVVVETVGGPHFLRGLRPPAVEAAISYRKSLHIALAGKLVHVDIAGPTHILPATVFHGRGVVSRHLRPEDRNSVHRGRVDRPGMAQCFVVELHPLPEHFRPGNRVEYGKNVARDVFGGLNQSVHKTAQRKALAGSNVEIKPGGAFVEALDYSGCWIKNASWHAVGVSSERKARGGDGD